MSIFDWLFPKPITDCSLEKKQLTDLQTQFDLVNQAKNIFFNKYTETRKKLDSLTTDYNKVLSEKIFLETQLGTIVPIDKPTVDMTYKRPVLVGPEKLQQTEIDLRLFCQTDFTIFNNLKRQGMIYDGTQDLDKLIPIIYKYAKTNLPNYGDDNAYGFSEFWMFSWEVRLQKQIGNKVDCDDMANWIAAHMVAARIPRNWFVSFGTTRSGFGHSTFYAKDSSGVWRHMNSTTPAYYYERLQQYPSNKDETDKIGITPDGFWGSMNDAISIQKFESTTAKKEFEKSGLPITKKN